MKFKTRRLFFPDLYDAPVWVNRLMAPINEIIDFMIPTMDKGLTFQEHIRSQIKEYRFTAPLTEVSLLKEFDDSIIGVVCMGVKESGGVNWNASSDFQWRQSGNQVLISGFSGLSTGTEYIARFLII